MIKSIFCDIYLLLLTVITGLLHPTSAPRVVLIHKQFGITMARDMLHPPKNYKLGHVIFADYEREETDCGLKWQDISMGKKCPRACVEVPLIDIVPHPEFLRYGINNSVALIKFLHPLKSYYMIPLCLPTVEERTRIKKLNTVFLIDYMSSVPKDFNSERMAKRTLKLFMHRMCSRTRTKRIMCSTGCGMRSGAPIITHAVDGRYELIGLAVGGPNCSNRSMRRHLNEYPPFYIDVYPYVQWIINIITAHKIPTPYPQNFQLVQGGFYLGTIHSFRKVPKSGWKGRTFLWGERCFRKSKVKQDLLFYTENFAVRAKRGKLPTTVKIMLQISAGVDCEVACVRVLLPHRSIKPKINLNKFELTLSMETVSFNEYFNFSLGISGRNVTLSPFRKWE